jgi:hypothetical protein
MRYQSLLSPGLLITAIASLLIVQACAKHDRAGSKYDLVVANLDREIAEASSQAMYYLQACYTAGKKPDCDQYREYKSTLENLSASNDRAANVLLEIQELESTMVVTSGMEGLIGE